ncbi:hypothetical protein SKAU_G00336250 [Synaphobranchus kaupii]|uniref:Uncharacterized protein n=1 Tax=Synaphobranchus kaupii TaxID=118154 RepID=A0A9Q1EM68_SYNKA|nr:hypothetical protein SKAU_G00336250 [Synaphobranchus kaupii]
MAVPAALASETRWLAESGPLSLFTRAIKDFLSSWSGPWLPGDRTVPPRAPASSVPRLKQHALGRRLAQRAQEVFVFSQRSRLNSSQNRGKVKLLSLPVALAAYVSWPRPNKQTSEQVRQSCVRSTGRWRESSENGALLGKKEDEAEDTFAGADGKFAPTYPITKSLPAGRSRSRRGVRGEVWTTLGNVSRRSVSLGCVRKASGVCHFPLLSPVTVTERRTASASVPENGHLQPGHIGREAPSPAPPLLTPICYVETTVPSREPIRLLHLLYCTAGCHRQHRQEQSSHIPALTNLTTQIKE